MFRPLHRLLFLTTLIFTAGCAGGDGGGGGCGGSGGPLAPLPGGYPTAERIENVAIARVTASGVEFLNQNIGTIVAQLLGAEDGILSFELPEQDFRFLGVGATICEGGPNSETDPATCAIEVDLVNSQLELTPTEPHSVRVRGPLRVRIRRLPSDVIGDSVNVVLNRTGSCADDPNPEFATIDATVVISVEVDANQNRSRFGYSGVRLTSLDISSSGIDSQLSYCGSSVGGFLLETLDGLVIGFLTRQLTGGLLPTVEQALCTTANPELDPSCPTGTQDVEGICRFGPSAEDECASILLGLDGNVDLGGLLAGISPGADGGFDFLFAAGGDSPREGDPENFTGDLNPVGGGMTLSLYGGA
ncbi:MAG: hypothetical protein AAGA56_15125 [Myxococcota bacterium]